MLSFCPRAGQVPFRTDEVPALYLPHFPSFISEKDETKENQNQNHQKERNQKTTHSLVNQPSQASVRALLNLACACALLRAREKGPYDVIVRHVIGQYRALPKLS